MRQAKMILTPHVILRVEAMPHTRRILAVTMRIAETPSAQETKNPRSSLPPFGWIVGFFLGG